MWPRDLELALPVLELLLFSVFKNCIKAILLLVPLVAPLIPRTPWLLIVCDPLTSKNEPNAEFPTLLKDIPVPPPVMICPYELILSFSVAAAEERFV